MKERLARYLESLCEAASVHGALLSPSEPPPLWCSDPCGAPLGSAQANALGPYRWNEAVPGWAINLDWFQGGAVAVTWPKGLEQGSGPALDVLEQCREFVRLTQEQDWIACVTTLLEALSVQRRQVGQALHRGAAQPLTAARLECSMLAPEELPDTLREAIESASEAMSQLVHGKLRSAPKPPDGSHLQQLVLEELHFQARWSGLENFDRRLELPVNPFTDTLAKLWPTTGAVERRDDRLCFDFDRSVST